jgi:hypothetical protein
MGKIWNGNKIILFLFSYVLLENMSQPTFLFNEKYSYPYNDLLKKYSGKFNPDTKQWSLPLINKKEFQEEKRKLDIQLAEKASKIWIESCHDLGLKFVKKDTEEYFQVKELFKLKMKC